MNLLMEIPLTSATGSATPPTTARGGVDAGVRRFLGHGKGDQLAIWLSGLCVVHCLASLLFLASMVSVGAALLKPAFHEIGLILAIALGFAVLITGVRRHGNIRPLIIGSCGLAIMAFALTLPHDLREVIATVLGVSILAVGHEMNRRLGKRAR